MRGLTRVAYGVTCPRSHKYETSAVPGATWMTKDTKAFVGELLINAGPRRRQYEAEVGQSLFNVVKQILKAQALVSML